MSSGRQDFEKRSIPQHEARLELRQDAGDAGPGTLEGYAAVFDSRSLPLAGPNGRTFREIIREGAFERVLGNGDRDLISARNHDPDKVLGRESNDTLQVRTDRRGLRYRVDLPMTSYARDTANLVEGGYIKGSSFTFRVAEDGDEWTREGGSWLREIHDIAEVGELGPVTSEAYPSTTVSKRALAAAARLPKAKSPSNGRVIESSWVERNLQRAPSRVVENTKAVAYHEAGHQVVAWALGAKVEGAEVRFRKEGSWWKAVAGHSHRDPGKWNDRELALSAIAGVVAEGMYTGERVSLSVSTTDRIRVGDYRKLTGTSEEELRETAREILERHEHCLHDLADRLTREGSISGEDARAYLDSIGDADPDAVFVQRDRARRRKRRAAGGWW